MDAHKKIDNPPMPFVSLRP